MRTYYILKMKNWNIDLYKKDKTLPFCWIESDKSFSENYEIIKQFESFADTINTVRKLNNEDIIESINSMCFGNEDVSITKDEKYIESLEKQFDKAKELLKKYNNKASCCGEFMKHWTVQKLWGETNKFLNDEIFESIKESKLKKKFRRV